MAGNINPAEIQDYYSETQSLRHERSTPSVKDTFYCTPSGTLPLDNCLRISFQCGLPEELFASIGCVPARQYF